jgi:uncharacterized protein (DUF2062 family)
MSFKVFRWFHRRGFSRHKLKGGRLHSWLGDHLFSKDLWQLKREPVARAWLFGCLIASSPLMGVHIVLSTFVAVAVRANLPMTFCLQWITNPFTAPVYYPAAFILGCRILGFKPESMGGWKHILHKIVEFRFHELALDASMVLKIILTLFLGCFVVGLVAGLVGYAVILLAWPRDKMTKKALV